MSVVTGLLSVSTGFVACAKRVISVNFSMSMTWARCQSATFTPDLVSDCGQQTHYALHLHDSGTSHFSCLILKDLHMLVFYVIIKYSLWFLEEHKLQVQTPPVCAVVDFQTVWSKLNFVQVRIECMCGQLFTCVCTREFSWNPYSNTQECGWPQYDHCISWGITQHYPSATFIL